MGREGRRHDFTLSRRTASEFFHQITLIENRGRREGRVPVAPMVRVQQKARGRTTGTNRINRPSLRNGFNGLLRALLGEPGFLATVIREAHLGSSRT